MRTFDEAKIPHLGVLAGAGSGPSADAMAGEHDDDNDMDSKLAQAMLDENYYDILGLTEAGCNATDEEIKKACTARGVRAEWLPTQCRGV